MSAPGPELRLEWEEGGERRSLRWRAEGGAPPPKRVALADDRTTADAAFRLTCEGTALLYRGDYHNARQLLSALGRRLEKRRKPPPAGDPLAAFRAHRQAQSLAHQVLSKVLVPLEGDYGIPLGRAPDLRQACVEAWGPPDGQPSAVSLRELLGLVGAHEWRRKGVEVPALGARVHPHYGVFAPVRGEYVDLVARAPLGRVQRAFDLGTGTGVLALLLAKRGVPEVVATDVDPRAVACARENAARLGLSGQVRVEERDLFPEGRADLIVFNPPWLPEKPRAPIERAIFDPGGEVLSRFLAGLGEHLAPGGEAWLVISDLAELLGLRPQGWLDEVCARHGLQRLGELSARPTHARAQDPDDPLAFARAQETTRLYRLGLRRG